MQTPYTDPCLFSLEQRLHRIDGDVHYEITATHIPSGTFVKKIVPANQRAQCIDDVQQELLSIL